MLGGNIFRAKIALVIPNPHYPWVLPKSKSNNFNHNLKSQAQQFYIALTQRNTIQSVKMQLNPILIGGIQSNSQLRSIQYEPNQDNMQEMAISPWIGQNSFKRGENG